MSEIAVVVTIVVVVLLGFFWSAIKVVREYERLVLFRLGKAIGVRGPGLVIIVPIIERVQKVDLREQFFAIDRQNAITEDNVNIEVDLLIYSRVFDAMASVIEVADFAGAARGMATTTLRAVIGDIALDEALSQRERLNSELRGKLDEVTARWGVKVTAVEIREILPPRDIQEAMTRQMTAERTRRATVTEADGTRAATIQVAEGDKRSAILRAEGERESLLLRAQGYAQALETIFGAARNIDSKTLTLQYLEALKALGASPATKIVLPLALAELIGPLRDAIKSNPTQ